VSNRIVAATRKGVFTIERTGQRDAPWSITHADFVGDNALIAMRDKRDNSMYVALHHGHFGSKLHRSADGRTWEEVAVPVYPQQPEGQEDRDTWGKKLEWKLDRIWALEPGDATQPGLLWCGTLPGGLFRSGDRGTSWEMVRPLWDHPKRKEWFGGGADLPGIHSICVDPRDANRVTVGISCGGVWITQDGGNMWNCRASGMWATYMPPERKDDPNIQDPHRVVQCPAAPDTLWAQHHNGIFRTTNACESWQDVSNLKPSSFGFAVAVHPREPNKAWFVPGVSDERRVPPDGSVVAARTRDGGLTYELLRNGLPQRYAYDLTYRHALDIDESGDRLAFGTTTGSVWISEDQGDSWLTVSEHLPPVYCVRFA
jgi:hypothetical protein